MDIRNADHNILHTYDLDSRGISKSNTQIQKGISHQIIGYWLQNGKG